MRYLVDTSVLVRAVHRRDPACATARRALTLLSHADRRLCVLPQNLAELWFVCTRPVASNGLGFSYTRTNAYVERFERYFRDVLRDARCLCRVALPARSASHGRTPTLRRPPRRRSARARIRTSADLRRRAFPPLRRSRAGPPSGRSWPNACLTTHRAAGGSPRTEPSQPRTRNSKSRKFWKPPAAKISSTPAGNTQRPGLQFTKWVRPAWVDSPKNSVLNKNC
ncbi:MAG: type II toxin-antitoxin system VapC family toxin [Bryobacterales bacterium]|nr:type II toxin-antitoxin system VapC family toxin [Bryobacterales bacterium]